MDCEFENCNLSMAKLNNTASEKSGSETVKCWDCILKIVMRSVFSKASNNCNLNHSSFYKTKLKKRIFRNLKLYEADFTECDLSGSVFENCDLMRANF